MKLSITHKGKAELQCYLLRFVWCHGRSYCTSYVFGNNLLDMLAQLSEPFGYLAKDTRSQTVFSALRLFKQLHKELQNW
jgi:hypothetical protein